MFRGPARRTTRRVMRRTRRRFVRRTVMIGGMVVIAAAGTAAAIKLSKQDAQRIEEHTGLPPEQLEDEDLNQAMQELNIQPQPLTPEEQAALAQQDGSQAGSPPASQGQAVPPQATPQMDYITELKQLAELRDQGIITPEEFDAKKKQLLGI
jgi:hypothetical protein